MIATEEKQQPFKSLMDRDSYELEEDIIVCCKQVVDFIDGKVKDKDRMMFKNSSKSKCIFKKKTIWNFDYFCVCRKSGDFQLILNYS